jgi:hypothetical protein
MLWLIWIAIILLTPIVAGVNIWREIRVRAEEPTPGEPIEAQPRQEL